MKIKDVEGYEGYYSVSDTGIVYGHFKQKLKPLPHKDGYLVVHFYTKELGWKKKRIHRLVAQAFIPNPKKLPEVNHKNMIRTDNFVKNLEWISHKGNSIHGYETKKIIKSKKTLDYLKEISDLQRLNRLRFPSRRYDPLKYRKKRDKMLSL